MDLADVLHEHGGAVLADFQETYSLDLVAMIASGGYSPTHILELIWELPPTSRFARALGGDRASWGIDRLLTMDIANQLRIINHAYAVVNFKKPKKPDLWEVPADPSETPSQESLDIEARMLAKWREEGLLEE